MQRTHVTLGGILVLQLLLILLLRSPFSEASRGVESQPLVPQLEAITATKVELTGADGESLTLVKRDAGWVLDEPDGFPADQDKVNELIEDLGEIVVRRPVVRSGRYHGSFNVEGDRNEGRLRVWGDPSGEADVDLILGSSASYGSLHVRRGDEDAVYEVRGLNAYDVRPDASTWAERQLVDVAEADLVGLTLTNSRGTLELRRDGDSWSLRDPRSGEDAEPDPDKLDALIQAVRSVRIADPVGAVDESAHGLSPAAATATLRYAREGEAEAEAVILVGRPLDDDETKRYITRSGSGYSGTIWESSVKELIERSPEDLLTSSVTGQVSAPDVATP